MKLSAAIIAFLCASIAAHAEEEDLPGMAPRPANYFYTGKPYDADINSFYFAFRTYDPSMARWTTNDPSGFSDGANDKAYAPVPTTGIDFKGLYAILIFTQTWRANCTWYYEATLNNSQQTGQVTFQANTGTNSQSTVAADPYGANGPLPGGLYNLMPRTDWQNGDTYQNGTPSITASGSNPGTITTPNGTTRTNLYVHGAGQSDGCVATGNAQTITDVMNDNLDHGGVQIQIINTPRPDNCE